MIGRLLRLNRAIYQHGITYFAVSLLFHPDLKKTKNGIFRKDEIWKWIMNIKMASVCLFLVFLCDIFLKIWKGNNLLLRVKIKRGFSFYGVRGKKGERTIRMTWDGISTKKFLEPKIARKKLLEAKISMKKLLEPKIPTKQFLEPEIPMKNS